MRFDEHSSSAPNRATVSAMTDTREPLATVQEAVAPTTAASPKASAAEAPKENAYAEIRQRAKSSFCFGTDDDVAAPVAAKPSPVMDAVDDSIARVEPKTLDMKDLRTACRERGLLVGGGKDALVERISLAIAAGTCAPMPPLNVESSGAAAGSKRSSPCANITDDCVAVARKIARTQHAGNAIFKDGEKQTLDPAWAPKADAFLGEMLSSPAKKVTVSDAKLRDLGVGRDIFSDAPSPSTARPTAKGQICERSRLGLQGNDIFADGPAMDTGGDNAVEATCEATKAKAKEAKGSDIFADASPESDSENVAKKIGLGKVAGAKEFVSSVTFGDECDAVDPGETDDIVNFGHKAVSDAMKASMVGNRLFGDGAEEEEAKAIEARLNQARRKDAIEARVIGGAHHDGHGIFSAQWTTARSEEEEAAAELMASVEEPVVIAMETPESVRGFKPIGQSTPVLDFRWKTEEEERDEEEVAEFVAGCIARVVEMNAMSTETEGEEA